MTTAVLQVERAGPLVTVQDGGRFGLMRYGVPASGPMDRLGHAAANTVLGQAQGNTAIEISLGGLALRCIAGSVTVAVCGGGFAVTHTGERCTPWTVRTLRPGDTFTVGAGTWGSWCYLAFSGDLMATSWLGSTATHVRAEQGGGVVRAGTDLVIDNARVDEALEGLVEIPSKARPATEFRVVLGPQLGCFQPEAVELLLSRAFTLTTAYDRMGVRLDGPRLELHQALAIPSSPIVRGSLQVAGDGVATLLLADHQTTGGYPKIATMIAADLDQAAQLRSGDGIRFSVVTPAQAVQAARAAAIQRTQDLATLAARPGVRTRQLLETNLIGGIVNPTDVDG